jgi:hypothetical protein
MSAFFPHLKCHEGRVRPMPCWIVLLAALLTGCQTTPMPPLVPKWSAFERTFTSASAATNAPVKAELSVNFTSPLGEAFRASAHRIGSDAWRVRFMPNQAGLWKYETAYSNPADKGLHGVSGSFLCTAPADVSRAGLKGTMPLDDFAARRDHFLALLDRPSSDLRDVGLALSPSASGKVTPLAGFFANVEFWRLQAAPEVLARQPGVNDPQARIAAARTDTKDMVIIYTPSERNVSVRFSFVPPNCKAQWLNPRTGLEAPAIGVVTMQTIEFPTPDAGDWLMVLTSGK